MATHISRKIKTVRVGDLELYVDFQRPILDSQVNKIVNNWDIEQFTYPSVGEVQDGRLIVWDGQHRVSAVKRKFGDDALIDVYYVKDTFENLARKFAKQDEARRAVSTVDKFNANVVGKEKEYLDIKDSLDKFGLVIGTGNPANHIAAANVIRKAYNELGVVNFERMINIMQQGFTGSKDIWGAQTLKGMIELFKEYQDYNIDDAVMIKQLQTINLTETLQKAKVYNPRNSVAGFVWHIAMVYNKKKAGKNRLDTDRVLKKSAG